MGVCMKKKRSIIPLFLLACIIIAGVFMVLMISTNEKLEKQEPMIYKSLDDFKNKKLTDAYKNMILKVDKKVQLEVDEQELSDLIAILVKEYEKQDDSIPINGYSAQIDSDRITIRLDSKLLEQLPVQYVLELLPSIEDNRLVLFVSKFKVGKLSIDPKIVLKQIKASDKDNYSVDLQKQSIVLKNKYSEQIILKDIQLGQGKVSMGIELSINNVKDLINVLGKVLPEDLKVLVDKVVGGG